ncbi:MAG: hypothetical protein K2J20_04070 [Bacilli bacterium]|nr:hypothetical protein [Bacilli bacterium]
MHNQNIHGFPPNIDPQLFAWLAAVIGSASIGDYTANEQNSFGNWLILVGQFVLTAAAQQTLIEARLESNNININSQEHKSGGSFYANGSPSNQTQRAEVDFLLDAVARLERELNNIKNNPPNFN